jgi:hypothetical protein
MSAIPKTRLVNLKLSRWAMVDSGDNPGAKVVMTKRNDEAGSSIWKRAGEWLGLTTSKEWKPRTTAEIVASDRFRDEFWKLRWAFTQSIDEVTSLPVTDEMAKLMARTTKEFVDAVKALSAEVTKGHPELETQLLAVLDDLVSATSEDSTSTEKSNRFLSALERLEKFTLPEPEPEHGAPKEPTMTAPAKKTLSDVLKALGDEERTVLEAALAKAEPEQAAKADTEAAPAWAVKLLDRVEQAEKRASEQQEEARKAKEALAKAARLEKAKSLKLRGVDVEKVADLFGAVENAGEDAVKSLEAILSAASKQARKGDVIFDQIGMAEGGDDGMGAYEEAEKKAQELRKARPELSAAAAFTEVLKIDRDLAHRVMDEEAGRTAQIDDDDDD